MPSFCRCHMSVPSSPAFRSHPFLEHPLNISSQTCRKSIQEPSTCWCVSIDPSCRCCIFLCMAPLCQASLWSPAAISSPLLPVAVLSLSYFALSSHGWLQDSTDPKLWPDLVSASEACGAVASDAIKVSSSSSRQACSQTFSWENVTIFWSLIIFRLSW